jgi:hypothetical protein
VGRDDGGNLLGCGTHALPLPGKFKLEIVGGLVSNSWQDFSAGSDKIHLMLRRKKYSFVEYSNYGFMQWWA